MALERVTRELVDLTPKMAAELLAKNQGNRGLAQGRVRALADQIERGNWTFNGQTIIVDNDGALLDGQHRCAAVVMAKKSVRTLIVRGVAREAFATIDSGRARSAADVLTAAGMTQTNTLAATLRLVWQYELGVLGSFSPEHKPSNSDIAAAAVEFPDVGASLRSVSAKPHTKSSPVVFMHWATMRGNKAAATEFWYAVETGEGQSRGSAALKLRDTLLSNMNLKAKHRQHAILEFCLRAWVHHLTHTPVAVLKPGILDHAKMHRANGEVFIPMTTEEAHEILRDSLRKKRA